MSHARHSSLHFLSDDALLRRLGDVVGRSRRVESDLVAHIAEVDRRRLYAREAMPSMFAYCTDVLHLSEQEAYLRIAAARASREHPVLLEMLADGRLHLTAIAKLAPHLTAENRDRLLARAVHRSKRQIEELIAELAPRPDAPALTRKMPTPRPALPSRSAGPPEPPPVSAPPVPASVAWTEPQLGLDRVDAVPRARTSPQAARVEPLAPARYKVQFTASAELHTKLQRLQALIPGADLAQLIDQAVTEKLRRLETRRFARTDKPRKAVSQTTTRASSRYIPAPVRRAVYERDGGRCTYRGRRGRQCNARGDLEFHHDGQPYARGGDHSVDNLRLVCPAHNALLAERDYGSALMAQYRRTTDRVSEVQARYGVEIHRHLCHDSFVTHVSV